MRSEEEDLFGEEVAEDLAKLELPEDELPFLEFPLEQFEESPEDLEGVPEELPEALTAELDPKKPKKPN